MKNYIFLLALCILNSSFTHASTHFDDSPDEKYMSLGRKFSSVGFFSIEDKCPIGSGVLVQTEYPELNGRVVMSAAHVLFDPDNFVLLLFEGQKLTFNLNGKRSTGRVFIPEEYESFYNKTQGLTLPYSDIAIFITDTLFDEESMVRMEFKPFEDCMSKFYVTAGYGNVSHVFSNNEVADLNKRASYSFCDSQKKQAWEERETTIVYRVNSHERKSFLSKIPAKYALNLTISEDDLKNYPLDQTIPIPLGLSSSGDSGGGVFSKDNTLIGIVSGGQAPQEEKNFLFSQMFYKTYPEFVNTWISENPNNPDINLIIPDDKIFDYLQPKTEVSHMNPLVQTSGEVSLLSFYQEWIQETLKKVKNDLSLFSNPGIV